jgi:hypothetical protein
MATEEQIQANRKNATHSTGPKSTVGKASSAQNATKHGLVGRFALLEGEDAAEFSRFREENYLDLKPMGALEKAYADRWISDTWRLERLDRIESGLLMNADISIADLISTYKLFNNASHRRFEELVSIAESALCDKLTQDAPRNTGAEQAGASVRTRVAKTAEGIKSEKTPDERNRLERALKQLCNEYSEAVQGTERDRTSDKPLPVQEGNIEFGLPLAGAVLERTARSFARNERSFSTLARYRATIENSGYRALHELQRLQAVRAGQVVAAPAAIDVNVNFDGGKEHKD